MKTLRLKMLEKSDWTPATAGHWLLCTLQWPTSTCAPGSRNSRPVLFVAAASTGMQPSTLQICERLTSGPLMGHQVQCLQEFQQVRKPVEPVLKRNVNPELQLTRKVAFDSADTV